MQLCNQDAQVFVFGWTYDHRESLPLGSDRSADPPPGASDFREALIQEVADLISSGTVARMAGMSVWRRGNELVAIVILVCACSSNTKTSCIEGQSAACACPSGESGAQVCSSGGAYGPCSCVGAGSAPTGSGTSDAAANCKLDTLKCASFSTQGQTGWPLHKLVFGARNAKRYAEAICLAQNSLNASDAVLVGASHFEAAYAWEGLGCHALAVVEIEASLAKRPQGKSGWKETCDLCKQLRAGCSVCADAVDSAPATARGGAERDRPPAGGVACCCVIKQGAGDPFISRRECMESAGTCVLPATAECKAELRDQEIAEERLNADMECPSQDRHDCDGDGVHRGVDKDDNDPKVK